MARGARIRGDFAKMRDKIWGVAKLAEGLAIKSAAQKMGYAALRLTRETAGAGRSPTGRAWRPLASHTKAVASASRNALAFAAVGAFAAAKAAGAEAKRIAGAGGQPLRSAASALALKAYRSGFLITSSTWYHFFHQHGAAGGRKRPRPNWRLPARKILPGRKLPRRWRPQVYGAASGAVRKILKDGWHY